LCLYGLTYILEANDEMHKKHIIPNIFIKSGLLQHFLRKYTKNRQDGEINMFYLEHLMGIIGNLSTIDSSMTDLLLKLNMDVIPLSVIDDYYNSGTTTTSPLIERSIWLCCNFLIDSNTFISKLHKADYIKKLLEILNRNGLANKVVYEIFMFIKSLLESNNLTICLDIVNHKGIEYTIQYLKKDFSFKGLFVEILILFIKLGEELVRCGIINTNKYVFIMIEEEVPDILKNIIQIVHDSNTAAQMNYLHNTLTIVKNKLKSEYGMDLN
jgi:hypothetical protein